MEGTVEEQLEGIEEENPLQGANSSRQGGGAALQTMVATMLKRSVEPGMIEEDPTPIKKTQKSRASVKKLGATTEVLVEGTSKTPRTTESVKEPSKDKSGGREGAAKNLPPPMTT